MVLIPKVWTCWHLSGMLGMWRRLLSLPAQPGCQPPSHKSIKVTVYAHSTASPEPTRGPRGLLRTPPCRSPTQHLNLQIKATPAAPSSEFCLLSWSSQALFRPQFLMSQRGKCPQIECWVTADPTLWLLLSGGPWLHAVVCLVSENNRLTNCVQFYSCLWQSRLSSAPSRNPLWILNTAYFQKYLRQLMIKDLVQRDY